VLPRIPPDVASVMAFVRPRIDRRPVRYTREELEVFIRNILVRRCKKCPIARDRLRKWAKIFVDARIESNDHVPTDMDPETYRVDRRHRRKDY
jgi:hypothetical protein